MKGKGKAIAIRPVVEIMKRHLPRVARTIGIRTTSRDSLRLFEGADSIKMRLIRIHGFEEEVVAAITEEEHRLNRTFSKNIRSSEKVNMSLRIALTHVFASEIEAGTVRIADNGVSKHGVANYASGIELVDYQPPPSHTSCYAAAVEGLVEMGHSR
jgi:hypothetical protein